MVRASSWVLVMILLGGCVRAVPIRAPTVVVVESVREGSFAPLGEPPEDSAAGWRAKDEVEVEWRGAWFPAVIVDKRGTRWLVHYEGYGSDWDELVGADRVRDRRAVLVPEEGAEVEDEPDP